MPCHGNGPDHCCYIRGKPCQFLIENHVDETGQLRKWACGLRAELGDWNKVLNDPRYIEHVAGSWRDGINCRDWPDGDGVNGDYCNKCGANPELKRGNYV